MVTAVGAAVVDASDESAGDVDAGVRLGVLLPNQPPVLRGAPEHESHVGSGRRPAGEV